MLRVAAIMLVLAAASSFAQKVPDIQAESTFYIESKSSSDESVRFQSMLERKIAADDSKHRYEKPGFRITSKDNAAYILRFMFVIRGQT